VWRSQLYAGDAFAPIPPAGRSGHPRPAAEGWSRPFRCVAITGVERLVDGVISAGQAGRCAVRHAKLGQSAIPRTRPMRHPTECLWKIIAHERTKSRRIEGRPARRLAPLAGSGSGRRPDVWVRFPHLIGNGGAPCTPPCSRLGNFRRMFSACQGRPAQPVLAAPPKDLHPRFSQHQPRCL